jgi:hypothetical protein
MAVIPRRTEAEAAITKQKKVLRNYKAGNSRKMRMSCLIAAVMCVQKYVVADSEPETEQWCFLCSPCREVTGQKSTMLALDGRQRKT